MPWLHATLLIYSLLGCVWTEQLLQGTTNQPHQESILGLQRCWMLTALREDIFIREATTFMFHRPETHFINKKRDENKTIHFFSGRSSSEYQFSAKLFPWPQTSTLLTMSFRVTIIYLRHTTSSRTAKTNVHKLSLILQKRPNWNG